MAAEDIVVDAGGAARLPDCDTVAGDDGRGRITYGIAAVDVAGVGGGVGGGMVDGDRVVVGAAVDCITAVVVGIAGAIVDGDGVVGGISV